MNFEKLVLGSIDADFRNQIFVGIRILFGLESFWRNLSDLHPFAHRQLQNFSKFSPKEVGIFNIRIKKILHLLKKKILHLLFSNPGAIFLNLNEIGSDFLWFSKKISKNAATSRNFSISIWFSSWLCGDLLDFDWIFYQIFDLTLNLIFTEPPPLAFSWTSKAFWYDNIPSERSWNKRDLRLGLPVYFVPVQRYLKRRYTGTKMPSCSSNAGIPVHRYENAIIPWNKRDLRLGLPVSFVPV